MSRSKNLTNYHSHSLYCDGRASMEDFVRFALSEGFNPSPARMDASGL